MVPCAWFDMKSEVGWTLKNKVVPLLWDWCTSRKSILERNIGQDTNEKLWGKVGEGSGLLRMNIWAIQTCHVRHDRLKTSDRWATEAKFDLKKLPEEDSFQNHSSGTVPQSWYTLNYSIWIGSSWVALILYKIKKLFIPYDHMFKRVIETSHSLQSKKLVKSLYLPIHVAYTITKYGKGGWMTDSCPMLNAIHFILSIEFKKKNFVKKFIAACLL